MKQYIKIRFLEDEIRLHKQAVMNIRDLLSEYEENINEEILEYLRGEVNKLNAFSEIEVDQDGTVLY